jgi:hypothetical protein
MALALVEDLVEQVRAAGIEGRVPELVDEEQLRASTSSGASPVAKVDVEPRNLDALRRRKLP